MNPFSKDYRSQIVIGKYDKVSASNSRSSSERRAKMMASDDPRQRMAASGFIPGIGRTDPDRAAQIRKGRK